VRETPHPASQMSNTLDLPTGLIAIRMFAVSYLWESGLPKLLLNGRSKIVLRG
jgi:hypothetical protein